MQQCITVLFDRKKKERSQNVRKTFIENLFLLFVVIAREHVGM